MKDRYYKIIIIGGGASGLAAALSSCACLDRIKGRSGPAGRESDAGSDPAQNSCQAEILILEKKDRPGSKILATGNGRCNLSNENLNLSCYRSQDPDRVRDILKLYDGEWTRRFFESIGLYTKSMEGYIYPYNEQASSVRNLLETSINEKPRIRMLTETEVQFIREPAEDKPNPYYRIVTSQGVFYGEKIIITTGGYAGPSFGCSGDGFRIAEDMGHKLVPPLPALTALVSKAPFLKKLNGVRCRAGITLYIEGMKTASDQGQIQWTDYGVSGVVVFQISRYAVKALSASGKEKKRVLLTIDFMPGYEDKDLKELIRSLSDGQALASCGRPLTKAMESLFHSKLIPVILREAGIDGDEEKADSLTDKKWTKLLDAIRRFPLRISGYKGYDKAQVTQGGVPLAELDSGLQSLRRTGIYFAGEVIDVDGICGGYNLQWAWSSGAAAGRAAAEACMKSPAGVKAGK